MRLLFVHERFGAMAGAEVNAWSTAAELKQRGHSIGILHGPSTGKGETAWQEVFSERYPIGDNGTFKTTMVALQHFFPDAVYVHKMSDLEVIRALVDSSRPLVRMVHDHEMYCMRGYKYHPLTRQICLRAASA